MYSSSFPYCALKLAGIQFVHVSGFVFVVLYPIQTCKPVAPSSGKSPSLVTPASYALAYMLNESPIFILPVAGDCKLLKSTMSANTVSCKELPEVHTPDVPPYI